MFLSECERKCDSARLNEKKNDRAYNTRSSQVVTHLSTFRARRCLTSEIERVPVLSAWYGRKRYISKFDVPSIEIKKKEERTIDCFFFLL